MPQTTDLFYLVAFDDGIKVLAVVLVGPVKDGEGEDGVAVGLVFGDELKVLGHGVVLRQVGADAYLQLIPATLYLAVAPVSVGAGGA